MAKSHKAPAQTNPGTAVAPSPTLWDLGNAFVQDQMAAVADVQFASANLLLDIDAEASAAWDDAMGSGEGVMPTPEGEPGAGPAEVPAGVVRICAKPNAPALTYEGIAVDGAVGHAWVEFDALDGSKSESWGFWPGDAYSPDPMDSYVPGKVEHPDPYARSGAPCREAWITKEQLGALEAYAAAHSGDDYSVFHFNCADFAVEAFDAAGQQSPSSGALGLDFPNALRDGIVARNEEDGLGPRGNSEAP